MSPLFYSFTLSKACGRWELQRELVFGFSLLDLGLTVGDVGVENQNPGMLLRACGGQWAACGGEPGFSRLGALGCRAPTVPVLGSCICSCHCAGVFFFSCQKDMKQMWQHAENCHFGGVSIQVCPVVLCTFLLLKLAPPTTQYKNDWPLRDHHMNLVKVSGPFFLWLLWAL